MIPPISIEELKEAWPLFLARYALVVKRKPLPLLALPVQIRCSIMRSVLKGGAPTELMLAIIAQMPLDERLLKDDLQKPHAT